MFVKFIIIALLSIILTGCGNNNNTSRNSNPQNNYSRLNNNSSSPLSDNFQNNSQNEIASDESNSENEIQSGENYVAEIKDEIYGSKEDLDIAPEDNSIARYTTSILTSDPNRYHNIKLVRDKLDGYVLKNNETFSFNNVCGPYGEKDGFKEATILLSNGKEDKGFGGGVCQLSTTLYNAVKDLNVEITERHNHSVPVAYAPKNLDATVSLQSGLDFKFKNVSGKNLRFETSSTENSLTVTVYEE